MLNVIAGLVTWAAMFAVAAIVATAIMHWGIYRHYRIPSPFTIILGMVTRGRLGPESNTDTILKALRRGLGKAFIIDTDGKRRQATWLTIRLSPEDIAELNRRGILDLGELLAGTYYRLAKQNDWVRAAVDVLILMMQDDSLRPNFPLVDTGNTGQGLKPAWFTELPSSQEPDHTRLYSSEPAVQEHEPLASALPEVTDASITATNRYRPETHGGMVILPDLAPAHPAESNEGEMDQDFEIIGQFCQNGHPVSYIFDVGTAIGRDESNDLVLRHKSVSRRHARLEVSDGVWLLVPEPGRHCYVNGVLIKGPSMVHVGDKLTFAEYPYELTVEAAPDEDR